MMRMRTFLKDCIPPILLRAMRSIYGGPLHFKGDYASWEEVSAKCSGYDAEHILAKVLAATLKVKQDESLFERDSVLFEEIEYTWPVLAGLMWAAALNGGKLSVLDFGGALGSSYFQNRKFLRDLPEVSWNVVEQAHYVKAGLDFIQDDCLRFYSTIDACLGERQPNVVLLSSVLEYLPDPILILNKIFATNIDIVIIDRSAFLLNGEERFFIQNVSPDIFSASIPCRMVSEQSIKNIFKSNNMNLMTEFDSSGEKDRDFHYRGLIFIRNLNGMPIM